MLFGAADPLVMVAAVDPFNWVEIVRVTGPFGLFLLLVLLGKFVPGFIFSQCREELRASHAENQRLVNLVLPALTESNRLIAEVAALLRDIQHGQDADRWRREQ